MKQVEVTDNHPNGLLTVEALTTCKEYGVTDGLEYLAEITDAGKELILLDNDEGRPSSVAYHDEGFLSDERFQTDFKIR